MHNTAIRVLKLNAWGLFGKGRIIIRRQGARRPRCLAKELMELVVLSSCSLTRKLHYILGDNYILGTIESGRIWCSSAT